MVIGYIKEGKSAKKFFSGIEIQGWGNNYVITVFNKEKNRVKKRLVKYIRKLKIEAIVFSKELEGEFKEEICDLLFVEEQDDKIKIKMINGKKLMEYMQFDILKYILDKQTCDMKQTDVYLIFKKEENLDLNFLKKFIENFRMTNIVTNDMQRLKNVQENLLENEGILIAVSNNKKKALKRAKYIINVNLNKEELEKYNINREAIIINAKENVKYDAPCFAGINVNYFNIQLPDEYMETFDELHGDFDLVKLYESILLSDNFHKRKIEDIEERIDRDEVKVEKLIGNNGIIEEKEFCTHIK